MVFLGDVPAGPRIPTDIPVGPFRECPKKPLRPSVNSVPYLQQNNDCCNKRMLHNVPDAAGYGHHFETAEDLRLIRERYVAQLGERLLNSVFWDDATSSFFVNAVGMNTRQLQKRECISLLGREMVKWCLAHPGEFLTPSIAQLWGYGDLVEKYRRSYACAERKHSHVSISAPRPPCKRKTFQKSARDGRKWVVERVVLGNGNTDRSGITLDKNVMYGSCSIHGGHESFFPILFYTLSVRRLVPKGSCQFLFVEDKAGAGPQFSVRVQSRMEALDAVMSQCIKYPGKPLVIGGPGSRGILLGMRKYTSREHGRVFLSSKSGECVHAAIINGIHRLYGEYIAREALSRAAPVFLKGLGDASEWLKTLRVGAGLCKLAQHERKDLWENPFQWIAAQRQGIFIVRLSGNPKVDHTVAVDANAGIIIDSEMRYPLVLSEEALLKYRGSHGANVHIGEVRKLYKEALGKRTPNS